jgi:multicomponent Na+:H+ antiporter subunit E
MTTDSRDGPPISHAEGNQRVSPAGCLVHTTGLALLWVVLTEGELESWVIGVPAVGVATAAAVWLGPPAAGRPRLFGLIRFACYFIYRSLVGGVDVARRALHPRLPLTPGLHDYPLRLPPDGLSRVFYTCILSLLPGTLGAELRADWVTVHVLDSRPETLAEIAALEEVIAGVFGIRLPPTSE